MHVQMWRIINFDIFSWRINARPTFIKINNLFDFIV